MIHQKAQDYIRLIQGQQLFSVSRMADMGCFAFGSTEKQSWPTYAVHLQCPFRLVSKSGRILFTSQDIYLSHDGEWMQGTSWDTAGANLFDQSAKSWFNDNPDLYVTSVLLTPLGDLKIEFSNEDRLEVFVNQSANAPADDECWRFLERCSESEHLVVSGRGDRYE